MKVRTRYAPSPTGYMHIGNLRTALYAYLFAKRHDGTLVLRIEDTDLKRYVDGAIDIIYKSLDKDNYYTGKYIGDNIVNIDPNEGVTSETEETGCYGPYKQSERKDLYKKRALELVDKGEAYYCFCNKHDQSQNSDINYLGYDRHCRNLSKQEVQDNLNAGKPYVIRQKMPISGEITIHDYIFGDITFDCSTLDDQILIKSDGMPTYNFANVVDDHEMQITHVMRGQEYISSAPKYELLYKAFGWDVPISVHLSRILCERADGTIGKMSKREGADSVEDLVNKGYLIDAIINYVVFLGWNPKQEREIFSINELIQIFDLGGLVKSDALFDYKKLDWFNGEYIKKLSVEDFNEYAIPYVDKLPKVIKDNWKFLAPFMQSRISNANQIEEKLQFLYKYDEFDLSLLENKKNKTTLENSKEVLKDIVKILKDIVDWNVDNLNNELAFYAAQNGYKLGFVMWPIRVALSGLTVTPCGSGEILYVLGKETSLNRLISTINRL